jgi:hypothetical protein
MKQNNLENNDNASLENHNRLGENTNANINPNSLYEANKVTTETNEDNEQAYTDGKKFAEKANKTKSEKLSALNEDEDKKVTRTSNIPTSYLSMALLGKKVSDSLQSTFSNLQIPNVDAIILARDADDMLTQIQNSSSTYLAKISNTAQLTEVNKTINKIANIVKKLIRSRAAYVNDFNAAFTYYGLVADNKNIYKIPTDNSERVQSLSTLLNRLNERGNPVAAIMETPYTMVEIAQTQILHNQLWSASETLRQGRSGHSLGLKTLFEKIKTTLSKILQYLGGLYKGRELAKNKRIMGFLKESL